MISGTAIDCFDRLSRVRAFPYGRFKIYSIVPGDRPDRQHRTQFYPSDRGHPSRPGRLRSCR